MTPELFSKALDLLTAIWTVLPILITIIGGFIVCILGLIVVGVFVSIVTMIGKFFILLSGSKKPKEEKETHPRRSPADNATVLVESPRYTPSNQKKVKPTTSRMPTQVPTPESKLKALRQNRQSTTPVDVDGWPPANNQSATQPNTPNEAQVEAAVDRLFSSIE